MEPWTFEPPTEHYDEQIVVAEGQYDCRNGGGGGVSGNETHLFVVSPALPEDVSEYELVFKAHKTYFSKDAIFEFII